MRGGVDVGVNGGRRRDGIRNDQETRVLGCPFPPFFPSGLVIYRHTVAHSSLSVPLSDVAPLWGTFWGWRKTFPKFIPAKTVETLRFCSCRRICGLDEVGRGRRRTRWEDKTEGVDVGRGKCHGV